MHAHFCLYNLFIDYHFSSLHCVETIKSKTKQLGERKKLGWISNGASKSSKILKISLKLLIYHVYWWSKEGCIGGFYINWCCIKKSSCPFFLETSMYYKIVNITAPCKYLITVLIYVKHFIRIVLIDDKHICMP